jgi:CheY-like chemotaxis protein
LTWFSPESDVFDVIFMKPIQNVVVVEDEPLFQFVIESVVRDRFKQVDIVQLGLEGAPAVHQVLEHVRGDVTLVICDRSLTNGGSEGEQIVRAVKEANASVIMYSSLVPKGVKEQLEALGIPCIDKTRNDSLKYWLQSFGIEKNS